MDLPGSSVLFALATVSITFVGFSALLVVFRQSMGGRLTRYDTYFTLSFIQIGFVVTGGALLPPVLALFDLSRDGVWRLSSAALSLAVILFVFAVPARRRAATGRGMPLSIAMYLILQGLAGAVLAVGATGLLRGAVAAVYTLADAALLFTSGLAYLKALGIILPDLAGAEARDHDPR